MHCGHIQTNRTWLQVFSYEQRERPRITPRESTAPARYITHSTQCEYLRRPHRTRVALTHPGRRTCSRDTLLGGSERLTEMPPSSQSRTAVGQPRGTGCNYPVHNRPRFAARERGCGLGTGMHFAYIYVRVCMCVYVRVQCT